MYVTCACTVETFCVCFIPANFVLIMANNNENGLIGCFGLKSKAPYIHDAI